MNIKKMVTGIIASTVCVIAVALPASAGDSKLVSTSKLTDENGIVKLYEEGKDGEVAVDILSVNGVQKSDIYGVECRLKLNANVISGEESINGCIGVNSDLKGWTAITWSNESSFDCKIANDGTLKYVSKEPLFNDDDVYCQIHFQLWWSEKDIELESVDILDKQGKPIKGLSEDDLNLGCICKTANLSDGTLKVTGFKGDPVDFEIPEKINGKKVTVIDSFAFKGCTTLKSVKIPDSVVSIGDLAFYECPALENITWSKKIRNVGNLAFYGCVSLKNTTLPSSVISIGNQVFYGCNLMESVTIPKSVTEMGDNIFGKCANVNIKCYTNSTAEKYAKDNKIKYTLLDIKKPADIKNFRCTAKTGTSISLAWSKNSTADGYIVERYNGAKWMTLKKITTNNTTSINVNSLKASTTYKYRIKAYKMNGSTALYSANSATLSVNTNPSGMSGYKVKSKTSTSVTLQWNKNTSATGYELQKWDGKKWVALTKITKNSTTTYTVKNLKAGTAGYRFRIRAYKTYGSSKQYGSWSSEVKVNTNPYGVGGFKCSSKTSTSVTLKWNKGTTASGYQLQQYKNGKWVTVYTGTKATSTSYTVKNLKAGTAGYRFRIRAYKTYGSTKQYGSWSKEVKVNTNPYGVGGFKAKATAKTAVKLGWNKGTTASGYQLQQYKNGKWVTIYTGTKATSTSYTVKSLKANTSYKFRIRAYKTYGSTKQYGSWSKTLTVKTKK